MVTAYGGVVCDGRRGPRDQYVCWGIWTTWVGGGQQPPAADWPAATLTPRPLPHTLLVLFSIIRLNTLRPVRPSRRKLSERGAELGGADPEGRNWGLPDGTHVPSVIVQKRFRFGEATR
ncbi:hypothetical protein ALC56_02753 [Trachymyrmex septentrionalis]|uniref:Uncharacterized protein n=1 Tax=Trachymyrmex septentrionalis TaxID=34720 RepID=A0A195FSR8_9HYME|nr:hypothetical protein ALC56_02753 [Trachymyrmex septentrionalis]